MQRQRKNLMPAFAFRHVKDLYPVFWEKSTKLVNGLMSVAQREGKESVESIDDAAIVEIAGWSSRATLDIIGVAGVSLSFYMFFNAHRVWSCAICLENICISLTCFAPKFLPRKEKGMLTRNSEDGS